VAMRSWFARGGWPVAAANPAAVAYTLLPPLFLLRCQRRATWWACPR
jgi:hypothetical protein